MVGPAYKNDSRKRAREATWPGSLRNSADAMACSSSLRIYAACSRRFAGHEADGTAGFSRKKKKIQNECFQFGENCSSHCLPRRFDRQTSAYAKRSAKQRGVILRKNASPGGFTF